MSQNSQTPPSPIIDRRALETLPHPVVAMARDFPNGYRIEPHVHDRAQLAYASDGVMRLGTTAGTFVVPPARAVWIPAGTEHWITALGALALRTLYIKPGAAPDLPVACRVVAVAPLLRELILAAMAAPQADPPDGPQARLMAVILDRIRALPAAPLHLPMPRDRRIKPMAEALRDDPADRRSLADWAKTVGASERTLARLFVSQTGLSTGAWRAQARLLKALELLAGGATVTAVALDVGYDSPSAFIAMFRRALGVSPRRYFEPRDRP